MVRSPIHHWGVAAAENIPARRYVMEYTGVLYNRKMGKWLDDNLPPKELRYIWQVPRNYWQIDGRTGGSGAEFVNHSCNPNLRPIFQGKRLYYFSTRPIKKGEELTIYYGESYFQSRRLKCACGTECCFSKNNTSGNLYFRSSM
jgi:SET domain-containing protein